MGSQVAFILGALDHLRAAKELIGSIDNCDWVMQDSVTELIEALEFELGETEDDS